VGCVVFAIPETRIWKLLLEEGLEGCTHLWDHVSHDSRLVGEELNVLTDVRHLGVKSTSGEVADALDVHGSGNSRVSRRRVALLIVFWETQLAESRKECQSR